MIIMIDNYDSFTYNLYQSLGKVEDDIKVFRNDAITIDQIRDLEPDAIVLSPGPGEPGDAGVTMDVIREFHTEIPILGVCLGHQAIAKTLGSQVVRAGTLVHGKISMIYHDGQGVFSGLKNPFQATRYHSLIVAPEDLSADLKVAAWTAEGDIMALRHREYPLEGVQFHPESILTKEGDLLLENFVKNAKSFSRFETFYMPHVEPQVLFGSYKI